jgi:hypothetical protein
MTYRAKPQNSKTFSVTLSAPSNRELARWSDSELLAKLVVMAWVREALVRLEAQLAGEIARREAFRADGATPVEAG